jgi:hypothetical protein
LDGAIAFLQKHPSKLYKGLDAAGQILPDAEDRLTEAGAVALVLDRMKANL